MRLHNEWRTPRLTRWQRLREWFGFHTHRAVHHQWDMDEPTWDNDPWNLSTCSCGRVKHAWFGETWQ